MTEEERGTIATRFFKKVILEKGDYVDDQNSKWTWECKNPEIKDSFGLNL